MHRLAPGPRAIAVLVLTTSTLLSAPALAQLPDQGSVGTGARRPFAKPGTRRQVERVRTFDVRHIKGELTLDTKKSEIRGTVTHTIAPLHPGLDSLTLDCGADLKVSRVAVGSKSCTFDHKGDELAITLDRSYGLDEPFDLAVTYAGSPRKGVRFVKPDRDHPKRAVCVWTVGEPEDARHWIPCFDYPNERSTAEMIITVEKPLSVVSNGTLESNRQNADGTSTYHWKMNSLLTPYLLSVVAADFAVYHDKLGSLPVDYYVLKEVDEATARRALGKTPRMIEFFNQRIGTPYAYPKYAQVCLPEFGGGMEHTSATTMTDSILVDAVAALESSSDGLVAHELAHQWFGDLLTCRDWSNLWLNEGFASYFDTLFTEHEKGDDAFRLAMSSELASYKNSDSRYRRPIVEARFGDPWQMFDGVTYAKGACVLHALRGLLGDSAWWSGIRLYVATYKEQVVSTDDFKKVMEKASGRDLAWFFDQWVYHGGHPELSARWRYEDDDKTLRLKVEQTQLVDETTPLFRLPTTIEIGDESGVRSVPVVIDGKMQEFVVPAPSKPRMVRIDPQGWLPKALTFDKPTQEWIYQLEHARNVLGRIEAAKELAEKHKDDKTACEALAKSWDREQEPLARAEMVRLVATAGEPCRAAILKAAKDAEPRVRVAALSGLAALKLDAAAEAILRATWANKAEAYSARRAALRGLVSGKVNDADELIASALKDSSHRHTLASAALEAILNQAGQKAREAAVLYSRPGQPSALRAAAIRALAKLAKDDAQAEKLLIALVDDPVQSVRMSAMFTITSAGLTSAVPTLERQLAKINGPMRQILQDQIENLKKGTRAPMVANDPSVKETADLERQAADLELQAKELRNQAEALKLKAERAKLSKPRPATEKGSDDKQIATSP
jgi:aminopeptidase N